MFGSPYYVAEDIKKVPGISLKDLEKWSGARTDPFQDEESIHKLVAPQVYKDKQIDNFIERKLEAARLSGDENQAMAWCQRKVERQMMGKEEAVDTKFHAEFIAYLLGKTKKDSPEYRIIQETNNWKIDEQPPIRRVGAHDVRAYINTFIDRHWRMLEKTILLKLKGPTTLAEHWMFFKYIVKGNIKDFGTRPFPELFLDYDDFFGGQFMGDYSTWANPKPQPGERKRGPPLPPSAAPPAPATEPEPEPEPETAPPPEGEEEEEEEETTTTTTTPPEEEEEQAPPPPSTPSLSPLDTTTPPPTDDTGHSKPSDPVPPEPKKEPEPAPAPDVGAESLKPEPEKAPSDASEEKKTMEAIVGETNKAKKIKEATRDREDMMVYLGIPIGTRTEGYDPETIEGRRKIESLKQEIDKVEKYTVDMGDKSMTGHIVDIKETVKNTKKLKSGMVARGMGDDSLNKDTAWRIYTNLDVDNVVKNFTIEKYGENEDTKIGDIMDELKTGDHEFDNLIQGSIMDTVTWIKSIQEQDTGEDLEEMTKPEPKKKQVSTTISGTLFGFDTDTAKKVEREIDNETIEKISKISATAKERLESAKTSPDSSSKALFEYWIARHNEFDTIMKRAGLSENEMETAHEKLAVEIEGYMDKYLRKKGNDQNKKKYLNNLAVNTGDLGEIAQKKLKNLQEKKK